MKLKEIVIQQVFECFMTSGGLYVSVFVLRVVVVFTQYIYPFLALMSVKNDTLKVITFDIPSITF